jgi:hypothetical protein
VQGRCDERTSLYVLLANFVPSPLPPTPAKSGSGAEGVRKKFVPLKSGDIVYMTASVTSPPLPSSPLGSAKTIYLSSTGPTNTDFGGIEVEEGCEVREQ